MKYYKLITQHKPALKAAKQWVARNKKPGPKPSKIWHYEYNIHTTDKGFRIFVVKYTLSGESEKQYYPGAHFSLYINKNGEVYNMMPGS